MKRLFLLLCLVFVTKQFIAQGSRKQSEPLKIEWQKELKSAYPSVSGLVLLDNKVYVTQTGDQEGSAFSIISPESDELFSSANYARIRSFFAYNNKLYSMGDERMTIRSISGDMEKETMLPLSENGYISSRTGKILKGKVYTTHLHSYFLKFSLDGEQLFKKTLGSCQNQMLDVGGNYLYVFSSFTDHALGSHLMQYDTIGNQKWSVAPGIFVSNMIADKMGNVYLVGGAGGKCYVQKYNSEGNQVWSSYTDGISYLNGVVEGDSLFVCGGITTEKPYDQVTDDDRQGAWAIYSVKTGERILNQTFNLYPGEGYPERFRQIAYDHANGSVYLGGSYGQEGNGAKCILVKLSRDGSTTGLKDSEPTKSFNVFPNPGGSKFTITCANNDTRQIKVTVRNLTGQVVYSKEIPCNADGKYTLDLGKQPAGNYTVEIVSGKDTAVRKILVE